MFLVFSSISISVRCRNIVLGLIVSVLILLCLMISLVIPLFLSAALKKLLLMTTWYFLNGTAMLPHLVAFSWLQHDYCLSPDCHLWRRGSCCHLLSCSVGAQMINVSFQGMQLTAGQRRQLELKARLKPAFLNPTLQESVDAAVAAAKSPTLVLYVPEKKWKKVSDEHATVSVAEWMGY